MFPKVPGKARNPFGARVRKAMAAGSETMVAIMASGTASVHVGESMTQEL